MSIFLGDAIVLNTTIDNEITIARKKAIAIITIIFINLLKINALIIYEIIKILNEFIFYISDNIPMSRKNHILILTFFLSFLCNAVVMAESEGEKLFKSNNPGAAIELLEKDIENQNISSDTYNYLGLAYFQIGEYDKAVEVFEKGQKNVTSGRKLLYFNKGNVEFVRGNYAEAEKCFSMALTASPDFYAALLNRANVRLKQKKYEECIQDYEKYIECLPEDPQVEEIERLLGYLEKEMEEIRLESERLAEEQKRIEEENRRLQEELARQEEQRLLKEAEEARILAEQKAAEEERRRKLLEEVANSLQQTDTTNMTAGAEDVLDYEYESELE